MDKEIKDTDEELGLGGNFGIEDELGDFMFDDEMDIGVDMADINLEDIEHDLMDFMMDSNLDGDTDTFDGKFFISYLGLNPLTLLFEEDQMISTLVYSNFDDRKLPFLIENLQQFIGSIRYKLNRKREEFVEMKEGGRPSAEVEDTEIKINCTAALLRKLQSSVDTLAELYRAMSLKVDGLGNAHNDKATIVDLVRDRTMVDKIISDTVSNTHDMSEDTTGRYNANKMSEITNVVNSIEALIRNKETFEGDVNISDMILNYKDRVYNYPAGIRKLFNSVKESEKITEVQMMGTLQELNFPVAMIGNENLFKTSVATVFNTNSTKMDLNITDAVRSSMFRLFNVYMSVQDGSTLDSFYTV